MTTKPKTSSAAQQINYIRANYGYLAAFLDIPEIRKVLLQASVPGKEWAPEKLQGAIYATGWWKKTAETTRQWIALQSQDPATAKQKLAQTTQQVRVLASQTGVNLSDAQVNQMALNINKFGWSEQQVRSAVGHQFHYDPKVAAKGQAALTVDALKETASKYLVPLSDSTINKWGQDVLSGNVDLAAFESYAKEQAKSMFPGLTAALDAGVTVAQYVEPYKQTAAQMLEIPPEQVNFMDPKWRKAVDQIDPKTGTRTSMSLTDWQNELRTNTSYGWDKTSQAREQSAQLLTSLGKTFGAL